MMVLNLIGEIIWIHLIIIDHDVHAHGVTVNCGDCTMWIQCTMYTFVLICQALNDLFAAADGGGGGEGTIAE